MIFSSINKTMKEAKKQWKIKDLREVNEKHSVLCFYVILCD